MSGKACDRTSRLEGKVAVVTGSGRGLGRAIALALAREGADVVVSGRSPSTLDDAATAVRAAGRSALAVPADVADRRQVEALRDRALAAFGKVDILVNNAGVVMRKPFLETDESDWLSMIEINELGVYRCCRAFGPAMVDARSGVVVNVSSIAGLRGKARNACYGATKAAVLLFTKALAVEWAVHNVRVNAIVPGQFDTDMGRPLLDDPPTLAEILKRTPLGRVGSPEEIGGLVVYLASDAASFVTGAAFVIDGGATAG